MMSAGIWAVVSLQTVELRHGHGISMASAITGISVASFQQSAIAIVSPQADQGLGMAVGQARPATFDMAKARAQQTVTVYHTPDTRQRAARDQLALIAGGRAAETGAR